MNSPPSPDLSTVIIALLRGVLYRDTHVEAWSQVLALQPQVRDYVAVLNLELWLDESEGHAYLKQRPAPEGAPELPRLVARRPLSFPHSLLLVLLRKKLLEHDAGGTEARLVLSKEQIVDLLRLFAQDSTNEAKVADRAGSSIERAVEYGFLRRLPEDQFEVRRILKAFVDAQWLSDFEGQLAAYRELLATDLGVST